MTCKTAGLIRMAKILKALEEEHNFLCGKDTVETIHGFVHASKLSNQEIVKEILAIHTVVEPVTVR